MTTKARALKYANAHRKIHVEWIEYWTDVINGEVRLDGGGVEHGKGTPAQKRRWHINCTKRYDTMIEAIKG